MSYREERSWFERNWLWAVPLLGCLSVLVLPMCVCGGCMGALCATMRGQTSVMMDGVTRATTHPEVIAALGEPVRPSVPKNTQMRQNDDVGFIDVHVPLEGPKGTGVLHIVASGKDDAWTFQVLDVTIDADGRVIALPLEAPGITPPAAETPETAPPPTTSEPAPGESVPEADQGDGGTDAV